MPQRQRFLEVTTGILVGLGWGLLAALVEGLPLLFDGAPGSLLGARLLALAYIATVYGALGAALGGLLGALALTVVRLARRSVPRPALAAAYAGLLAGATVAVLWLHRYQPGLLGWLLILVLAAIVGLAIRWLLNRAARTSRVRWVNYRAVVLLLYATSVVAVVAVAAYRSWFGGLPLFDPPVTDLVATVEQPNIVLVTAAGLRPDHLGAYGHDPAVSPNIDALAQRGVRFDQVFSQAAWTEPSLASLLTSLYPSELGTACQAGIGCQPHLDLERTTLPEVLNDQGYRTQAYVTSHWLAAELGFDQGFDGFQGVRDEEPFDAGAMRTRTLGQLLGCSSGSQACRLFLAGRRLLFEAPIPGDGGGNQVNARVKGFLDLHGNELFFLWVHYNEALPAYDTEPPLQDLPDDPSGSTRRQLSRMGFWQLGNPFTARESLLPNDGERLAALYDGEVHGLDKLVGDLAELLEDHDLADRTLVVLTSDHGQEFMEHGGYTYGHSLYDEVLRVPLILAGPGVDEGRVVDMPVGLLDLSPTLVEIAGGSHLPDAEGRSLAPALRGDSLEPEPIYSESLYRVPYDLKSLRQDGYKLIFNANEGTYELYDLRADPTEQRDVSSQASHVADEMRLRLLDWMAHSAQIAAALPRALPPMGYTPQKW